MAKKEAVPDEWGQAAFVSALVEGLAGVVDKDILFRKVEISPKNASATINGKNVPVSRDQINQSNYVVLQGKGNTNDISIKFK